MPEPENITNIRDRLSEIALRLHELQSSQHPTQSQDGIPRAERLFEFISLHEELRSFFGYIQRCSIQARASISQEEMAQIFEPTIDAFDESSDAISQLLLFMEE
jgi:CRISPR/Cas system CSM-associated protein Csm2 small subunit